MSDPVEYKLELVASIAGVLLPSVVSEAKEQSRYMIAAEQALALLDACKEASVKHHRVVCGFPEPGQPVDWRTAVQKITGLKDPYGALKRYSDYLRNFDNGLFPPLTSNPDRTSNDNSSEVIVGAPLTAQERLAYFKAKGILSGSLPLAREGYKFWWSRQLGEKRRTAAKQRGRKRARPTMKQKRKILLAHLTKSKP